MYRRADTYSSTVCVCTHSVLYLKFRIPVPARALAHQLSAFLFLNFYRDFHKTFYMGFPTQIFKNHFIGLFRSKKFQLFSGPQAWVGLRGGLAGAARARAPMRGIGKHPERLLPKYGFLDIIRPSVFTIDVATARSRAAACSTAQQRR